MKTKIEVSGGFSLVEVLLGVFIFAVGLLGIAALQLFAKQNSLDTVQRTNAALLVAEMAERIRANPKNASSYVSSFTNLTSANLPSSSCSSASSCDGAAIVAYDRREWYRTILGMNKTANGVATGGFVNPSACITAVTTTIGGNTVTIGYDVAIAWRGKAPLANSAASTCGESEAVYGTGNRYRRVLVYRISV